MKTWAFLTQYGDYMGVDCLKYKSMLAPQDMPLFKGKYWSEILDLIDLEASEIATWNARTDLDPTRGEPRPGIPYTSALKEVARQLEIPYDTVECDARIFARRNVEAHPSQVNEFLAKRDYYQLASALANATHELDSVLVKEFGSREAEIRAGLKFFEGSYFEQLEWEVTSDNKVRVTFFEVLPRLAEEKRELARQKQAAAVAKSAEEDLKKRLKDANEKVKSGTVDSAIERNLQN